MVFDIKLWSYTAVIHVYKNVKTHFPPIVFTKTVQEWEVPHENVLRFKGSQYDDIDITLKDMMSGLGSQFILL